MLYRHKPLLLTMRPGLVFVYVTQSAVLERSCLTVINFTRLVHKMSWFCSTGISNEYNKICVWWEHRWTRLDTQRGTLLSCVQILRYMGRSGVMIDLSCHILQSHYQRLHPNYRRYNCTVELHLVDTPDNAHLQILLYTCIWPFFHLLQYLSNSWIVSIPLLCITDTSHTSIKWYASNTCWPWTSRHLLIFP